MEPPIVDWESKLEPHMHRVATALEKLHKNLSAPGPVLVSLSSGGTTSAAGFLQIDCYVVPTGEVFYLEHLIVEMSGVDPHTGVKAGYIVLNALASYGEGVVPASGSLRDFAPLPDGTQVLPFVFPTHGKHEIVFRSDEHVVLTLSGVTASRAVSVNFQGHRCPEPKEGN